MAVSGRVDAARLWAGGLATAVTAALVALTGILIARGIFDIPVLAPEGEGVWSDVDTARYVLFAGLGALVATGVIHLLIVLAPRYELFFSWIIILATAVGALAPFAGDAELPPKLATSLINLAIGAAIGSLVAGVARSAIKAADSGTRT